MQSALVPILFGGTYTPAKWAPGLSFWVDASNVSSVTLNVGDVSSMTDLSGNGRNASQGISGQQPAYLTGAGGVNNKGVVSFTAANNDALTLSNALDMAQGKTGVSFAGVVRIPTLGSLQRLFTVFTNTSVTMLSASIDTTGTLIGGTRRVSADAQYALSSTAQITASVAAFVAVTVNYSTGEVVVWVNGVSRTGTASWATGATNENLAAGIAPVMGRAGVNTLSGDEAELCFWPRTLTAPEVTNLRNNYFKPKWNLA